MRLGIYCLAWREGGPEERKLRYQEKVGRIYARWTGWMDEDCEVYRDIVDGPEWADRPGYERLIQDINRGRIAVVWATSEARLHPYKDEKEWFARLCRSRAVRTTFERT